MTATFVFGHCPLVFPFFRPVLPLGSDYSVFRFTFPCFSDSPHGCSSDAAFCLPASSFPPDLPPSFLCFASRLVYLASACFFSLYPGWLPQLLFQVITFRFRLRCFSHSLAFFRPLDSGSCYSDFRFYRSLHPASPNGGSDRANLSTFRLPVSMHPSGFGTGHAASSVHRPDFRHTAATFSALPFLSSWQAYHGFRFRFGLLGLGDVP